MSRSQLLLGSAVWTVVAGAGGVLMPTAALAQDAGASIEAASSEAVVPDIVVTAQRREQSLQRVPISIAVESGETMRRSQVTNLNDLGNRLSGVKVNKAGASDSLNIRGIGSGFNMGFEQSVATFIDGVYVPRSQSTRAGFLDLERIEVLKGPQSTYFGSNAIAGALSATTRKPTQTLDGYANALYSPSDGEYNIETAIGGPLTDKLSGRAAGRLSGMNGYVNNLRRNQKGPRNRDLQARGALRYQTPGVLDINLRVDYAHYNDKHSELQEVLNCPPAAGYPLRPGCTSVISAGNADNSLNYRTSTSDSFFKLDSVSGDLIVAWTVGNHTMTSTTGYYYQDIHRFTGSPLLAGPGLTGITDSSGLPITQREKFRSISQEVRLQSEGGNLIDYMVGAYYDNSDLKGSLSYGFYFPSFAALVRPVGSIPAGTPIAERVFGDQDQQNRSVFAALTVNLAEQFRVNLGARYSSVQKKINRDARVGAGDNFGEFGAARELSPTAAAAFAGSVGFPLGNYAITRRTDDKFMPSINVQYDVLPTAMLYASYSTGFKAGGWAIGNSLDIFGPETVKSYEGGVKASWLGKRVTTNLSVFSSNYNGLQESTSQLNGAGVIVAVISNVAKARSRGVDLEIGIRPFSGFSISTTVGYLDAKYLAYTNAPCTQLQLVARPTGCTQNLAGKTKAYAPEWSGSVNVNYAFNLSSDITAKLGGWLYFTSGYYQQATHDPLFYQSGYAKLDLRAAIAGPDDRWEVAVIGKNVTDKATAAYRSLMTASNAVTAVPDRPRSIAVQLSTKF